MTDTSSLPTAAAELDSAFEALKTYDIGAPRGMLCGLDQAIIKALPDRAARTAIEGRLIAALTAKPSAAAVEYVCSKLALFGSEASVRVLAELLSDPVLCTCARNALEKISDKRASKALRQALGQLSPANRAGVIQSLGARRDDSSVSLFAKCLTDTDAGVARSAAAALGEIGSPKAAAALKNCLVSGPKSLHPAAVDAALVCAERLIANGHRSEARSVYQYLLGSTFPRHVQQAASRGLANCAAARSQSAGT